MATVGGSRARRRLGSVVERLRRHSRIEQAVRAALAAAVAWALVQPLPGVADQYPYYAPLGAVIAVSTTLLSSARESAQGVLAILLGASVAWVVDRFFGANVLTLAAVVAVGTVIAGWRYVGGMASWVPVSGMFVLIIGEAAPTQYVVAYAGLTALGAGVGVAVNLLFPPLPLTPAQDMVARLRSTLAEQLDDLADGLLQEEPLTLEDWRRRRWDLDPLIRRARGMVQQATEARRGNWRARRWVETADRQYDQARTLEQLAFLVEELTEIIIDQEARNEHIGIGSPLRALTAHALGEMADLLESVTGLGADPERLRAAHEGVSRLVEETRAVRARSGDDLFAVGGIVLTLRRALSYFEEETGRAVS